MNNLHSYFTTYKVKEEDYLYKILRKYESTTQSILIANKDLNPFLLEEDTTIIIPIKKNVVSVTNYYDFSKLKSDLITLKTLYPFLSVEVIGLSVDGREIYGVTFGKGENTVIYNASHHGNEWITSLLLMKWLEKISFTYSINGSINGYYLKDIFNESKIIIVPMVNPDGVELVINGLSNIKSNHDKILKMNLYNENFENWKANLNGVDLNRNYPAGWKEYKKLEHELGIFGTGPYGYGGIKPFSEPETKSLGSLTSRINSRLTLSYHSQGEVIYWKYLGLGTHESKFIGVQLSKVSGYKLDDEALSTSFAGYKDWYINSFNKPGFTIEVGIGINPLDVKQFDDIYDKNEELLLLASVI